MSGGRYVPVHRDNSLIFHILILLRPSVDWMSMITLVRAYLYLIYEMKCSSLSETTHSHTQKQCFIFSGKLTNNHHTSSRNLGQLRNDSSALLVIIVEKVATSTKKVIWDCKEWQRNNKNVIEDRRTMYINNFKESTNK